MKIHQLLKSKKNWTKGFAAKNKRGCPVFARDKSAVRFCLAGAACKCYRNMQTYAEVLVQIDLALGGQPIPAFNDDPKTTHADVLRLAKELNI
jgi:hypothetical protein